jgi:hypothetical protein
MTSRHSDPAAVVAEIPLPHSAPDEQAPSAFSLALLPKSTPSKVFLLADLLGRELSEDTPDCAIFSRQSLPGFSNIYGNNGTGDDSLVVWAFQPSPDDPRFGQSLDLAKGGDTATWFGHEWKTAISNTGQDERAEQLLDNLWNGTLRKGAEASMKTPHRVVLQAEISCRPATVEEHPETSFSLMALGCSLLQADASGNDMGVTSFHPLLYLRSFTGAPDEDVWHKMKTEDGARTIYSDGLPN